MIQNDSQEEENNKSKKSEEEQNSFESEESQKEIKPKAKAEEKDENDKENRFQIHKDKQKSIQLEVKRKKAKKKKIMSLAKSNSKGSEILKKIKYIDLFIGILVLVNFAMSLYENDQYTSKIVEVTCNKNTKTSRLLNEVNFYNYEEELIEEFSYEENDFRKLAEKPKVKVPEKPKTKECLNRKEVVKKQEYELTEYINKIRIAIIAVIGLNEILLIYRYILYVKLMRERYLAVDKDNLFSTGLWWQLFLEFIVLGVCIPPYTEGVIKGDMLFGTYMYSYDSIVNLFQIFKLYYFFKIYAHFSMWSSEAVKRFGIDQKVTIGLGFALKAQIRNNPLIFIFIMLILCTGIFGFMLRILEYGYTGGKLDQKVMKALPDPNWKEYADPFWVIITTMMTVAYGDIYPDTHLGRLITVFASFAGMFIVSLLVVTLSTVVEFLPEERKAHNVILKFFATEKMEKLSHDYVKAIMKLYLIKKSEWYLTKKATNKKKLASIRTFVEQVLIIKEISNEFNKYRRVANSHVVPADEILVQLDAKIDSDTDVIGPEIYALEDMNELTNNIIENEYQIKNAIEFLKEKQEDLISYLIKFNTIKSSIEILQAEPSETEDQSDLI
jgi:hypothetical protein